MYNFKDKSVNVHQLNNYMLTKTLSMFEWENLPDTIPQKELEKMLQINGYAFITECNSKLYAFTGGLGGECDAYGNPTQIIINNPHLNFNKTLSIADDGVLIINDDLAIGLMPMLEKHNSLLIENDINMVLHGYNTRMQTLISASDDNTKDSAQAYIDKVVTGEISVIAETALFDGIRVQSASGNQTTNITQLTEYHQYIKASLFNELGLTANFNMKRERLVSGEVEQGEDSLFPYVYNMMQNRLIAANKLNELYDIEINVDFGSVWYVKNRDLVDGLADEPLTDMNPIDAPVTDETDETDETPVTDETTTPVNDPLTNQPEPLQTPHDKDDPDDEIADDETSIIDDKVADEVQAKTLNELVMMLEDESLSDDDINAVKELIAEMEQKDDE